MNRLKLLASSLLVLTLLSSCSKQEQSNTVDTTQTAAVKSGQGLAIVRAVNPTSKTVTLAANNIPGIMDAMTMDYPVADSSMLQGIAVGDSVSFTLEDRGMGNYMVTKITPLKKG